MTEEEKSIACDLQSVLWTPEFSDELHWIYLSAHLVRELFHEPRLDVFYKRVLFTFVKGKDYKRVDDATGFVRKHKRLAHRAYKVSPACFKKICMMRNAAIREYFLNMETQCKQYACHITNARSTDNRSIVHTFNDLVMHSKAKLLEKAERIYIFTSKHDSDRNVFKISQTILDEKDMYCCWKYDVYDAQRVYHDISRALGYFKVWGKVDTYKMSLCRLIELVYKACQLNNDFIDYINRFKSSCIDKPPLSPPPPSQGVERSPPTEAKTL